MWAFPTLQCKFSISRMHMCQQIINNDETPYAIVYQVWGDNADNADHNVRTLDGLGTFHGMGIIAALTPGMKQTRSVPRIFATAEDVAAVGKIDIPYFNKPLKSILSMVYQDLHTTSYQLQGSNMDVRSFLESHIAHPFTEAWVVWHDAGYQSGKSSRKVVSCSSANDRHGPKWHELCLFHTEVCSWISKMPWCHTCSDIWPAIVVEGPASHCLWVAQ